ncbi:MAG: hypothetical protein A2284_01165 [Deltaproteobacteria bacterium RIFOXYA12_FULL_61_11]|nr:MAG: hypothetical protein A2284_01165 [Deltaproteobacteria bacterium RIFOXYA12_FULL_61_11]
MNAIETRIVLCCTILLFFAPKHGFAETTKSTEQYLAEFKQALGLHERRHLVKEVFSLPDVKKKKEILLKVAYFLNDFLAERINTRKMDDEYYQYQEFGNMVVWTLVYQHLPTDPKEFLPLEAKELEPLLGQPLPITPEEYLPVLIGSQIVGEEANGIITSGGEKSVVPLVNQYDRYRTMKYLAGMRHGIIGYLDTIYLRWPLDTIHKELIYKTFISALDDPYWGVRELAVDCLIDKPTIKPDHLNKIKDLAKNDPGQYEGKYVVRDAAIKLLKKHGIEIK